MNTPGQDPGAVAFPREQYEALESAVMESERGRWFLAEYARRNRNPDTAAILGSIERLEDVFRDRQALAAQQHIRIELLDMAPTIARTRDDAAHLKRFSCKPSQMRYNTRYAPCIAPHKTNPQAAPCHRPTSAMMPIRLKYSGRGAPRNLAFIGKNR